MIAYPPPQQLTHPFQTTFWASSRQTMSSDMTFLLDTNVWLWWTYGSTERFSIELRHDIGSPDADVFVSIASLWEIAIKGSLKKLEFPANPGSYALRQLKRQRFNLLNVDAPRIGAVATLPHNHRDPFDRMIIAQAMVEALTIVTADRAFASYDVSAVWV
jgi:PIN domain nuclease of toxin-antitoxin system